MKVAFSPVLLLSLFLPRGAAFVGLPSSSHRYHDIAPTTTTSSSRLHESVVFYLDFDDDDDEDDNEDRNAQREEAKKILQQFKSLLDDKNKNNDQQGEVTFVVQGSGSADADAPTMNAEDLKKGLREALGSIFGAETTSRQSTPLPIQKWKDDLAKTRPYLTLGAQLRLEKEMALLQELQHGDQAVAQLEALWQQARGSDAAKMVLTAAALLRQPFPVAWSQAETILLRLIKQEGVQWVVPLGLLADLRQFQGRLDESKQLYELVLSQKPWHLGALQGLHTICRSTNDYAGLAKWDGEQLPPLGDERRVAWVQRMVERVQAKLNGTEQSGSNAATILWADCDDSSAVLQADDAWQ